jgi:hypothetical protein
MSAELRKIRDNLIGRESSQKIQATIVSTVTMIKFLSKNLKFVMSAPSKDYTLKTLSSRMSQRPEILTRFVNGIACEMLTDSAISKSGKGNILRGKSGDLAYLIVMTNGKVHIYGEIGELTNRSDICYKEGYGIPAERETAARHIHEQHFRDKAIVLTAFRSLIREWIAQRRTWEYTTALDLYLSQDSTII